MIIFLLSYQYVDANCSTKISYEVTKCVTIWNSILLSDFQSIVILWFQIDFEENKNSIIALGGGSLIALWLASALVGAIDSIPLVRLFSFMHGECVIPLWYLLTNHILTWVRAFFFLVSHLVLKAVGTRRSRLHHLVHHPLPNFWGRYLVTFPLKNICLPEWS